MIIFENIRQFSKSVFYKRVCVFMLVYLVLWNENVVQLEP